MTKYTLTEAIGNISDRHIIESAFYRRKAKRKAWVKISVAAAACAAVLFTAIPIYKFITSNECAVYPFWDIKANSYEEAVVNFNDPLDDLLIDKLIINGISANPHEYYSVSIPNGKSNQRSNWDSLDVSIHYTDNYESDYSWVQLTILLDYKEIWGFEFGYAADFKYGKYEVSVETINGYSVEYIAVELIDKEGNAATDENGNVIVDHYSAHFTNNNDEYYLSGNDLQLLLDTIRQMTS